MKKYPNVILWGNNTFHRVNSWDFDNKEDSPKYISIGISGTLESWRILTYEEVMAYTNNQGVECKDLLDINTKYHTR